MKWAPLAGGAAGLALAGWLLHQYGLGRIVDLIGHAGWLGLLCVVACHGVQMLFSAMGWREIAGPAPPRASLGEYVVLRWIREAVNNLLPLSQIGGEVVSWRLLRRRGTGGGAAVAGTVADLTIEVATQLLFTLLGLCLLRMSTGDSGIVSFVANALLLASVVLAAVIAALWLGVTHFMEKALLRLGRWLGWAGAAHMEGVHRALVACYRAPGRVALSASWHLISWLLGGVEVCLALHFLVHDVGLGSGLVIESLGQAAKTLGFAVPGALGVQEGGYVVVCGALGLLPELAIALSLLKRVREAVLGVPAIVVWQHVEARMPAPPADALSELPP